MKNLLKKLIVVLFLMLMLINNSLLVIVSNAIDEVQNTIDENKIEAVYELNLKKYVNYNLDSTTKGLMIQTDLKTGITYKEGKEYIPILSTGIVLNLPEVNNEYPQKVEIIGNSTKATNGSDEAKDFQYEYDANTGKLKIGVANNSDENGNIYTENVENARDEYSIISYYSEACYNDKNISRSIALNGKIQENLADEDGTQIIADIEQSYDVSDNILDLISTNVETSDIYNGFINSNNLNNTTYTTEYTEDLKIDISYKEISDELKITSDNSFINNNNVVDTDEIIYKSTKIKKQEVLDKLGEDGYLKILNTNGDVLGEINKDTETPEDGMVEFKYEEGLTEIIISLSKPINVGTLNIQNTKQIKETMKNIENNKIKTTYNIEAINNVQKLDENTGDIIENNAVKIYEVSNENLIDIKEAETKIDLNVDKSEWTNNEQNDVTFTATLLTNNNSYELFKNPVIDIKLPSQVEKVILGDTSLLYENGLTIKSANVVDIDNCKVIRIELDGKQSEYMLNPVIAGTNILINASIIVKKDITSAEANIEMTYSNEIGTVIDYEKENKSCKEYKININSIIEEDTPIMLSAAVMSVNEVAASDEISAEMMATVGNQVLKNEDSVYENQIIKYTAKITNNSDKKVSNIKFTGIVPEGTTYVTLDFGTDYEESQEADDLYKYVEDATKKEYSETFSLEAHEEKEIFYEVKVNKLSNGNEVNINSNLKIYTGSTEKVNYSITNNVKNADMSIELKSWKTYIDEDVYLYRIKVINNKDEEIKNPHVELLVPDGFEITETDYYEFDITKEDNTIKIDLDKLEANETVDLDLYLKINATTPNVYEYNINTYATAKGEGTEVYYSNENRQTVYMIGIEVVQTSEKEGQEVKWEEEIEYEFVIRNVSNENVHEGDVDLYIADFIDENVEPISAEYEVITYNEETGEYERETKTEDFESIIEESDGEEMPELGYYSALPIGEEIKLKLKVQAGIVSERTTIMNNISVQYNETTKISNTIKNVIIPDNGGSTESDKPNTGDGTQSDKLNISGIAWEDSNDDGQINGNENKISNLNVMLFNVNTNSIAKDSNNNNITVVTDGNGNYKFENIEKGNYLVVFEYDVDNYNLSTYKKSGIKEQNNSDVIERQLQIGSNLKTVAVTDIININSANVNNINIGLVPKSKFDLSLNKSITKVTVKYDNKEKEKDYAESKLAKVEIPARKISKSTIVIEYQLEVKNEGDIDAYVDEIVDYVPETLEYDIELNSGWYDYGNGKVKYTALSGDRIKPGESKVIKLYLTKETSDSSVGIITNTAEITKSSNPNNAKDIDSIEGNRNEDEDDYSEAQIIISIGTGAVTYTLLLIGLLIVYLVIRHLVNKKVINIKNIKVLLLLIVGLGIIIASDLSEVFAAAAWKETAIDEAYENAKSYYNDHGYELHYKAYSASDLKVDDPLTSHIYLHHTDTSSHASYPGFLWCSDGRTQCGAANQHYYKLKNVAVTYISGKVEDNSVSSAITNNTAGEPDASGTVVASTEYSVIGPFKVTFENTAEKVNDKYKINATGSNVVVKNEYGEKLEIVTDDNATIGEGQFMVTKVDGTRRKYVLSGTEFYIKVKTGVKVKNVTLKNTVTYQNTSIINYKVKETWKCVKIISAHGHCTTSKMQVMVRSYKAGMGEFKTVSKSSKIVLKTNLPKDGALNIIKLDNATYSSYSDGSPAKISHLLGPGENIVVNSTLNAGFLDGCQEIEDVLDSDYIIPLDGIKFIICRITMIDGQPNGQYEFITAVNGSNRVTQYSAVVPGSETDIASEVWNTTISSYITSLSPYVFDTGSGDNDSGQIKVEGLTPGYYRIIEVGSDMYEYQPQNYPSAAIYVAEDTVNTYNCPIYVPNDKKVSTSVSGYVWQDLDESKGYIKDHVYNLGTEWGMDGITVRLIDASNFNVVSETQTSELGIYDTIIGGEYIFNDVPIQCLSYYYVEFEYNGVIYQASTIGAGSDDTINSKAMEGNVDGSYRQMFDGWFASGIVNNGYYSAKVKDIQVYGADIAIGYAETGTQGIKQIDRNNMSNNCNVTARTQVSGWDEDTRYSLLNLMGIYGDGVMYVNLGIYEKPQADLRVNKDVEELTLEFGEINAENGHRKYSHTYKYHQEGTNETEPTRWNFGTQFQTNTGGYQRKVYKSDIDYNQGNNVDIYMTYKIQLTNEGSYNAKVNSIIEYYSTDYTIVEAWTKNNYLTIGTETRYNDNYNACTIETNMNIVAGYQDWLYVKLQVTRDAIYKLINQSEINEFSITEITHYTVYKDDNFTSSIAAVDKDSVPGNATPGNVATYEDDTDAAPNFRIVLNENGRTIQGTVFEDEATESSGTGNVREGNGIFDESSEKRIANVEVTLKGVDNTIELTAQTDENGNYIISGFIPGQYEIIYKWGNNEYRVQKYKGTIYDTNRNQGDVYWYRYDTGTRKTDAIDDYNERVNIDNQMAGYTDRNIYTILDDAYGENYTGDIKNSINSVTPTMQFEIEYDDTQVDVYDVVNIDFGIIKRAEQKLDVEKRVTNFKITLANGQELVNATVLEDGTLQGLHTDVTYMGPNKESNFKGWIKAEIDNELIEGAKAEIIYEIKYVNNSELDYMTEDFYKYGNVRNPGNSYLVTLTPYGVLDYLDKSLGFEANKNEIKWTEIEEKEVTNWYTDKDKSPEEISTANLLYAKEQLTGLKPSESGSINLNVSKLLAVSDELTFDNKVDTVQISKPNVTTQQTGSIIEYFPNADAEEVIITPSTGDNKAYVLPVITGIASLIILGVGIFMIKKKVINS